MIKKILSLTLSAFIALSSSGCGNASAAEASPTAQEVATTTEPETEPTTQETEAMTTTTAETTTTPATTVTSETTTEATTTTPATTTASTTVTTTTTPATTTTAPTTVATTAETTVQTEQEVDDALKLSNPNASPEAVKLFEYICGIYGEKILSGQQESTWMGSDQYEFEYINKASGKYPAIRGLDYMNDDFKGVNKRAKDWFKRGGIVTICWHCGSDFSGSWSESMNTTITNWDKALTEGTAEYRKLIEGMDKGAKALQELRDAGIPVLWRPFHELDGAWFWWGKGGADNFVKLWRLMYDRYTNYWKLDNLI